MIGNFFDTVLNYEEIKKDPQRITKIKPLINEYNWEGINYPYVF